MATKKEVAQEFRKSELLRAARTVFSRRGFHDSTIDEIAAEAGVAKGTVYLYFQSKQDIYLAALRDGIKMLNDEMRSQAATRGSAKDRLRNLIATKISFFDANLDFFQILQSELSRVEAAISQCRDLYFEQVEIIEGVLHDGIQEGDIKKLNTKKAALAFEDLTKGGVSQRVHGWSKTRMNDEIDFTLNLLWKGIAK